MQDKINIIYLIQGLNIGGLEKMVVDLVNNLPDRYKVTLCCYDNLGILQKKINIKHNVEFIKRKPGFDLSFIFRLAKYISNNSIDILHVHNNTAFFYGTIAGRLGGAKRIIYTEHGRTGKLSKAATIAQRILCKFVSQTVVVSDYLKEVLSDKEGFPNNRLSYIPNGIDDSGFYTCQSKESICNALQINQEHKYIGVIARLDPIKNHKLIITSLEYIVKEHPEVKLLIVGDGPEKNNLHGLVSNLQLKDSVYFLGEREDIPNILSLLDIFILPSFSEGMSITLIEAMAAKLPVIATNVGGNPLIINHLKTGLIVESDNVKDMTENVLKLLNDRKLCKELACEARKDFERQYTVQKMVERYQKLYEE